MIQASMRFCGYTLRHNPKSIEVTDKRNLSELETPYGGSLLQDMGNGLKTVTGIGEFFGNGCMRQYKELQLLLRSGKSGLLSLPGYEPFFARFALLELTQPPAEDFISYRFVFLEESNAVPERYSDGAKLHTVEEDETLWDIAFRYDVPVETLLKENQHIRRPDCLKTGEKVSLP